MKFYHYVATFYDGDTHECVGRLGGFQTDSNNMNPEQVFHNLAEQLADRMQNMHQLQPGSYFIINPFNPIEHNETVVNTDLNVGGEPEVKPSWKDSKPGDLYYDANGVERYHVEGMSEPVACSRCGTVPHRPDGSHYCHAPSNTDMQPQQSREREAVDGTLSTGQSTAESIREHFQQQYQLKPSERTVQCDGCWYEDSVANWLERDGNCPECNTDHAHLAMPR